VQDHEEARFGCVAGASDKVLLDIRKLIEENLDTLFSGWEMIKLDFAISLFTMEKPICVRYNGSFGELGPLWGDESSAEKSEFIPDSLSSLFGVENSAENSEFIPDLLLSSNS
jgi:hypothetical protein